MKPLNEIIIISDYDCNYCLSVMYRGIADCKEVDDIEDIFKRATYNVETLQAISTKYKCDVLLCQDGCIDYVEYKEDAR